MSAKLFARTYGPKSSQKTPVVILHGLFGSSTNWNTVAQAMATNRPVYALDLRNHGQSEHADEMSYAVLAEDVDQFMRQADIQRAVIMGHSMGGKVAMQMALHSPDRLSRLIVVDIAPVQYHNDFSTLIQAMQQLAVKTITSRSMADQVLSKGIPDPQVRSFALQNLRHTPSGYQWRINLDAIAQNIDKISGFPNSDNTPSYKNPALFIRGELSNYVLDAHIPGIKSLFPGARIESIPAAGHWLHAEQQDIFLDRVLDFID